VEEARRDAPAPGHDEATARREIRQPEDLRHSPVGALTALAEKRSQFPSAPARRVSARSACFSPFRRGQRPRLQDGAHGVERRCSRCDVSLRSLQAKAYAAGVSIITHPRARTRRCAARGGNFPRLSSRPCVCF
jgi:hypothetical protein